MSTGGLRMASYGMYIAPPPREGCISLLRSPLCRLTFHALKPPAGSVEPPKGIIEFMPCTPPRRMASTSGVIDPSARLGSSSDGERRREFRDLLWEPGASRSGLWFWEWYLRPCANHYDERHPIPPECVIEFLRKPLPNAPLRGLRGSGRPG